MTDKRGVYRSRYQRYPRYLRYTHIHVDSCRSIPRHCFALLAEDGIALGHENGYVGFVHFAALTGA